MSKFLCAILLLIFVILACKNGPLSSSDTNAGNNVAANGRSLVSDSTSAEINSDPIHAGERTGDSRTIPEGLLNAEAVDMPKPPYPPLARAVKASGKVVVNIEVDTKGSVVKAEAVSGHPLLKAAAVQAARQAKFKPGSAPLSGSLEYEFAAP
jgi:TonB family protein